MSVYASFDRTKVHILIIEDEPLFRNFINDYLIERGYMVTCAKNGREGLELFNTIQPDLVMTDLHMPEMNGLELIAALKAKSPNLPIIVVSGTDSLKDVVQTLKLGAWDYVLKPIQDFVTVDMAVDRAIERKKIIEENRKYREHLEQEVQRRTTELIKADEKCKVLFNHAGAAIFMLDAEGHIIETNKKASDFLGFNRETFLRMTLKDLYSPAEGRFLPHYLDLLVKKKFIIFESSLVHREGHVVPVEVNVCQLDVQGMPTIFAICRDISERKLAEEEHRLLEKQLLHEQKMESLGILTGGIAHDFKNILHSISECVQSIEEKMEHSDVSQQHLMKIKEEMRNGIQLADRLMSFACEDNLAFATIDLHKLLKKSVDLLRPHCPDVSFELDLTAAVYDVLGNMTMLQNAIITLGLYACDAMNGNGILHISTHVGEFFNATGGNTSAGFIRILVSDNSYGMSTDIIEHIFEPSFASREQEAGARYDLSSVYSCVKYHRGIIDIESSQGRGTTFRILLPLIRRALAPSSAVTGAALVAKTELLIIDDDKIINELVQKSLHEFGYDTVLKEKMVEAIDYYESNFKRIALVLIDYSLPLMSGEELFRELKKYNAAIKALYLTNGEIDAAKRSGWDTGIVGYVVKPFKPEQLCFSIVQALVQ